MARIPEHDKFVQQAVKYSFSLFGTSKTGQTTEYQAGDDGTYEKGHPEIPPRFEDNGDGTITDLATGLMWVKDPINNPGAPFDAVMTWVNAVINCEALNFAGHADWRLPNTKELESIVNYGQSPAPTINQSFFPNTLSQTYWSSTTYILAPTIAKAVRFGSSEMRNDLKTEELYCRPVRLGLPA